MMHGQTQIKFIYTVHKILVLKVGDGVSIPLEITGNTVVAFLPLTEFLRLGSATARFRGLRVRFRRRRGCLLWMLCVVRSRSLRRANHWSRGVLPNIACYRVASIISAFSTIRCCTTEEGGGDGVSTTKRRTVCIILN